MTKAKIYISVFLLLIIFFSCNKKENPIDITVLDENILVEGSYADMSELTEIFMLEAENILFDTSKSSVKDILSNCASLIINPLDSVSWPKSYTVDFGSINCLCDDGRYRRGKFVINATGMYNDSSTVLTITYNNYFLNDNKISALITITNKGLSTAAYPNYTVSIQNAFIETSAGTISWQSERVKTWVYGSNTPWPLNNDDVFIHAGSTLGTYTDATSFESLIISPLVTYTYCPWISSGIMEITNQDNRVYTLNFGAGDCDSLATIIVDGESFGVGLK